MTKVNRLPFGATGAYLLQPKGWQQTPKWHWRYWIGHRMRCWERRFTVGETHWYYRTFRQHARAVLEEQSNGGTEQQDTHGGRSPTSNRGLTNLWTGCQKV